MKNFYFALKRANNTSSGFDGLTCEFFKLFWIHLGYFMLRAINAVYEKGELSESMKRGVITCILKGKKDKALLKFLETNIFTYKLASSCTAEILKKCTSKNNK